MQKVFDEVNSLDKRCYEEFGLSEDILMEHAAASMMQYIQSKFVNNEKILIVCGSGNNGADGIALARLLYTKYDISLHIPFGVKSDMAKLQHKRAKLLGVDIVEDLSALGVERSPNVVVDCLFGSGLSRALNEQSQNLIKLLNSLYAHKIACDIPSGIFYDGQLDSVACDLVFIVIKVNTCLVIDIHCWRRININCFARKASTAYQSATGIIAVR